jgi:rare lipoprotein A
VQRAVTILFLLVAASCAHAQEGTKGFHPPIPDTRASSATAASSPSSPEVLAQGASAPSDEHQVGLATWYGSELAGHKTASGERFDPGGMTAAHRKLPLGTWVDVRRVDTGRSVRVRINDRGPFGDARKVIDLSRRAAEQLDMIKEGAVKVEVRVVRGPE